MGLQSIVGTKKSIAADLLSGPWGDAGGCVEDQFMQEAMNNQVAETLTRYRSLSMGFKKDYLGTFAKDDEHLSDLAFNHNPSARQRAAAKLRRSPSAPTFESLHSNTQDLMRKLDPNFDAHQKEY